MNKTLNTGGHVVRGLLENGCCGIVDHKGEGNTHGKGQERIDDGRIYHQRPRADTKKQETCILLYAWIDTRPGIEFLEEGLLGWDGRRRRLLSVYCCRFI